MSKCHHHHHHHHHHRHDRCEGWERPESPMPMEHPCMPMPEGCGVPRSMPIEGRCVMTPRGPICCVALPHHRMR